MDILIIKLGAIGDVIRTTSLLGALKEKYPYCNIDWATKSNAAEIVKNNHNVDLTFIIDESNELLEKMLKKYDLVINFDDEEAACELAGQVKKGKLIGAYSQDGKRKYTEDSAAWFDMGLISKFGKIRADELKIENKKTYHEIHFGILGLKNDKIHQTEIFLNDKNFEVAGEFAKQHGISENGFVIGINTGAGGRWQDKKLPIGKAIELILKLEEKFPDAKMILFGGPEEKERNKEILNNAKNLIDAGCNNSLLDFAGLVNLCTTLITSDSLAMHIGIALKKKIVAFFCPTSCAEIELYGRGVKILPKKGCVCCYKSKCDIRPEWDVNDFLNAVER
jgi:heptosyltransferase II